MNDDDKCFACGKAPKDPMVVTLDAFYCRECARGKSPASIDAIERTAAMITAGKPEVVAVWQKRYSSSPIHGTPHKCMSCGESPWHLIRHEGRTECIPCALVRWPEVMADFTNTLARR